MTAFLRKLGGGQEEFGRGGPARRVAGVGARGGGQRAERTAAAVQAAAAADGKSGERPQSQGRDQASGGAILRSKDLPKNQLKICRH